MFRKEDDPPAIVKEAEEQFILRQLAKRIRPKLRKEANNCMEVGEDMERIFGMVTGRARQAFLTKEFGITERQAWKYLRAWRGRDRIRENPSEHEDMDAGLPASLAAAMRLLEEEEVTSNGDVPFKLPDKPKEPPREPGSDEGYQQMKAAIQGALCDNCKRKGISCDKCRAAVYKIEHPNETPAEPDKPKEPRKPPSDNGSAKFDWIAWNKNFGFVVRGIDRLAVVADIPNVHPKLENLRLKAGELLAEFKTVSEEILKQKAPQ